MDITKFTAELPGELIPIEEGDHAFVPNPLPPTWEFPIRLWPLLREAVHQIGILEGTGKTLPNPAILLRPLEDREAIQSSRLEGTYATPKELLLFEMEPRESESEQDPANAWREVLNYRRALDRGTNDELPLCLRLIRELHRELLQGVRGKDRTPGHFRRFQVAIGSTKRFIPPPASRLEECLDPLEKYLHKTDSPYDALVDCFLVHYQFETIHPFSDGNGRVGRLLLVIMLQRRFKLSKPWLYLSEYFERFREEYVEKLFNVSVKGNWEEWIEFCLRGTISQAQNTIGRCERLLAIRGEFQERVAAVGGSIRLQQILERVFHSPFVRVADLARMLEVSYPTAKADLDRLVQAKILRELPSVTPKTFYAPEVFNIAYEDIGEIP